MRREDRIDYPSLNVAYGNDDFLSTNWLGLNWTKPAPLTVTASDTAGVYRIISGSRLAYVGESSNLESRLAHHRRDQRFSGSLYSYHEMSGVLSHQLLERETDLIGSYFLKIGEPPWSQYRPS